MLTGSSRHAVALIVSRKLSQPRPTSGHAPTKYIYRVPPKISTLHARIVYVIAQGSVVFKRWPEPNPMIRSMIQATAPLILAPTAPTCVRYTATSKHRFSARITGNGSAWPSWLFLHPTLAMFMGLPTTAKQTGPTRKHSIDTDCGPGCLSMPLAETSM